MLTRHRQNQRTLDRITDKDIKLKTELKRIQKDINNNVLMKHRPTENGLKGLDPKRYEITSKKLLKCDEAFTGMAERLEKKKKNGEWNKSSVKE